VVDQYYHTFTGRRVSRKDALLTERAATQVSWQHTKRRTVSLHYFKRTTKKTTENAEVDPMRKMQEKLTTPWLYLHVLYKNTALS
jgi:hypothetical protein